MIKIFVCEDDKQQRQSILSVIEKYLFILDYPMTIEPSIEKPQELLDCLRSNERNWTGLYFLDVDLGEEMNGLTLAAKIREHDPSAKIVIVTTHAELAYLTFIYKLEAMDYITKDNPESMYQRIRECIDTSMKRHLQIGSEEKEFVIISKNTHQQEKLAVSDVLFFETSVTQHKIIAHLENRQIEFYGKIKEMVEKSQHFYRCHQSYVVNVTNIETINFKDREIKLKNGASCPASIRYIKGLKKNESKVNAR